MALLYMVFAFGCENACDATVLSYIETEKHKAYGNTIVQAIKLFSEPYFIPGASTIGGRSGIKRRLSMIMNYNRHSFKRTIVAGITVIVFVFICLTNPVTSEQVSGSSIEASHTQKPSEQESLNKEILSQTANTGKSVFVESEDTMYIWHEKLTNKELIERFKYKCKYEYIRRYFY